MRDTVRQRTCFLSICAIRSLIHLKLYLMLEVLDVEVLVVVEVEDLTLRQGYLLQIRIWRSKTLSSLGTTSVLLSNKGLLLSKPITCLPK